LPDDEERLRHFVTDVEGFSVGEIAARLAGALDFPSGGYLHQERDRWREVAELLKEREPVSQAEKDPTETLIPISRLRRFYESLRLINTSEVHRSIAAYLRRYRNVDQPFHQGVGPDWFPILPIRHYLIVS